MQLRRLRVWVIGKTSTCNLVQILFRKLSPEKIFHQVQSIKLEFESVVVEVRKENQGVFFGLGQAENQNANHPQISADLGFFLKQTLNKTDHLPPNTSDMNNVKNSVSLNPLVLWFHFQ